MENTDAKMGLNSITSLFKTTWRMYKERSNVLMEILLLPALIIVLGGVLFYLGGLFTLLALPVFLVGYLFLIYSFLPLIFSIHHDTDVDTSYKATLPLFWKFVWVFILEAFIIMGAFFMLIIPGIWLSIALSFSLYLFIIEDRRGLDVLRQSRAYVKGYWWAILGRVLLVALAITIPNAIVQGIFTAIAGKSAGTLVSVILMVIFTPFSAIFSYNLIQNLRSLKPELAGQQTKEGTGFLKASGIVGIVAPIALGVAFAALAVFIATHHITLPSQYERGNNLIDGVPPLVHGTPVGPSAY